jgi:hypothetical protein
MFIFCSPGKVSIKILFARLIYFLIYSTLKNEKKINLAKKFSIHIILRVFTYEKILKKNEKKMKNEKNEMKIILYVYYL